MVFLSYGAMKRVFRLGILAVCLCSVASGSEPPAEFSSGLFLQEGGKQFRSSTILYIILQVPVDFGDQAEVEVVEAKMKEVVDYLGSEEHLKDSTNGLFLSPQELQLLKKKVQVRQREGTDLVNVTVTMGDAHQSQILAKRIGQAYVRKVGPEGARIMEFPKVGVLIEK